MIRNNIENNFEPNGVRITKGHLQLKGKGIFATRVTADKGHPVFRVEPSLTFVVIESLEVMRGEASRSAYTRSTVPLPLRSAHRVTAFGPTANGMPVIRRIGARA